MEKVAKGRWESREEKTNGKSRGDREEKTNGNSYAASGTLEARAVSSSFIIRSAFVCDFS